MPYPIFDLAASEPLLDCSGLTAARTYLFPDWSGRVLLANDNPQSLGDFASGGVIGTAATTVDITQSCLINQTTAGKVLTLPAPTSGLAVFYTLYNVGTAGFYAYGRYIRPGGVHTFVYVPTVGWRRTSSSPMVIDQSWVGVTAPANDTNENTLYSITIPGGTIGANGALSIRVRWDYTNSSNTKTLRARLGGSLLCTFSATTSGTVSCVWDINNRNSASAQVGTNGAGGGAAAGTTNTAAVDTSADQTLTITAQKATGTETVTMLGVTVTMLGAD